MQNILTEFLFNFAYYLERVLPAFLLAILISSAFRAKVSDEALSKVFSRGPSSILISSIIGAPLPICSCTVLPIVHGLREKGVPSYSIAPFLISAPTISLPSILISLSLLGPEFTLLYVLASTFIAIVIGALEYLRGSKLNISEAHKACHMKMGFFGYLKEEVRELLPLLFLGSGIASAISLIPTSYLLPYLSFPAGILSSFLISLPNYICSSGSVPIVASLFKKGLFLGGGIIILILGPATNVPSILLLKKILGKEFVIRYLIVISSLSVAIAFLIGLFLGRGNTIKSPFLILEMSR